MKKMKIRHLRENEMNAIEIRQMEALMPSNDVVFMFLMLLLLLLIRFA